MLGPFLFACTDIGLFDSRLDRANRLAQDAGWRKLEIAAGRFLLTGYLKNSHETGNHLNIYIEGDGNAWEKRRQLASDPTPREPLVLKLAMRDPGDLVLYLARPCQYVTEATSRGCHPVYWSSARYSEDVVWSINHAIEKVRASLKATNITLLGYSGGGVIAALVAARRNDVRRLTTIGANLDINAWTSIHGVSPLNESLNPIDFASQLKDLPQCHLVGGKDAIVPPSITNQYFLAINGSANAKKVIVPNFDHTCCWAEAWPNLLKRCDEL